MTAQATIPALISPKEAATLTTMSKVHLANLSKSGKFPAMVSLSAKRVAYSRTEVIAWIEERLANRGEVAH